MAAQNADVRQLNDHPLNRAALVLLRRAATGPQNPGALEWMHLLSLASIALPEFEDSAQAHDDWLKLAGWTWSVSSMRAALATLEGVWEPAELLGMSPREAGKCLLGELGISS